MFKKLITWLYNKFVRQEEDKTVYWGNNDEEKKKAYCGHKIDDIAQVCNTATLSKGCGDEAEAIIINVSHTNDENSRLERKSCDKPSIGGEPVYSDIVEVEIDGEKWWHVNGYFKNRPEERKLKAGDAIVYRHSGYKENSVIIIKSFDFPSDTAARALIGNAPFRTFDKTITITYYSDFVPSFKDYRMARREEVAEFLENYKKNNPKTYMCQFEEAKKYNNPIYHDLLLGNG